MKASKPYFSHDIAAKTDEKIIRLMFDFRKSKNEISESIIRDLVAHAAYGIYWEIIEYLHENNLKVDEIDMLADELRIDVTVLQKILDDFDLFKKIDGKYISERVLKNLKLQEEKSEKARRSVANRYNGKGKKGSKPEEEEKEKTPEYNEQLVMSIVQIYNEKFKNSRIISKENKEKIFAIHAENNLNMDIWEKVFANAKRGWDINGKKNVKPTLPLILEKWDSFASDDYFLAPDREAIAEKKEEEERAKAKEYLEQEERNRIEREIQNEARANVCDKNSALDYIYNFSRSLRPILNNKAYVARSSALKEFKDYDITADDVIEYFKMRDKEKQGE
ncbi:MAG: hypothetical protein Q4E83_03825 [bacterium]|nr:hypothetical protein [bacterium]